MNSNPYVILVVFETKVGLEQEFKQFLLSIVKPALSRQGCIIHDLHQCMDNPCKFMFYEQWASQEAHEAHVNTQVVTNWRKQLNKFLIKPYDASCWEPVRIESRDHRNV